MVSLDHDSTRQGGYFFAGEGAQQADFQNDDEELISNGLSTEDSPKFFPMRSAWASALQILILVICEILVILTPLVIVEELHPGLADGDGKQQVRSLEIITYLQASTWILLLVLERYLHWAHRRHMLKGYLLFYRSTQRLKRVPLYSVSSGCVALVVLCGVYLPYAIEPPNSRIWPVMYAQLIVSLEIVVSVIGLLIYTTRVVRFNQKHPLPDVEQEEFIASITQPSASLPDIGYRDAGYMENLLEKQADMIHYLKLRTEHLSKKILRLTRLTHPSGSAMNSIRKA